MTVTLAGQAAAQDAAGIRPLVSGIITEISYQPGEAVGAGDPLFRIDPTTYEAELASAEAQLQSAEVAVPAAEAVVSRAEQLLGTGSTQETLDNAQVSLAQARAAALQAQAAVQTAQINLDRTTITSPIAGYADLPEVSVGDLVTASQSATLTTVTSLDPIFVDLSEANARMLMMRARMESGEVEPGDRIDVSLRLENGEEYTGEGTLVAVARSVSTSTGTVNIRMRFDNPDNVIVPGMFVTATLTLGTTEAFLVPQLAASPNADGTVSIWLLDETGTARESRVTSIGSTASAWIVADGIEDGATLLVDNIDGLTDGTEIEPVPVTISDTGVISDLGSDTAGGS